MTSTAVDAGRWIDEHAAAEFDRLRGAERRRVRRREQRADNPGARGPEVLSMLGRMLPRLADHIDFGAVDPAQVRALRTILAQAELDVIARMRAANEPWSFIGAQLGITPQAAQQRWARSGRTSGATE